MSIISGFVLAKTGQYRVLITGAFGIMVVGFALLATLDHRSSYIQTEFYLLIASIGVGPLFQAPLIALQSAVSVSQMATTTSCFGLIRTLGGTIGISVGGAIYSSELTRRLSGIQGYAAQTGAELSGNVSGLINIEPVAVREQVLFAYTRSLMTIWIIGSSIHPSLLPSSTFLMIDDSGTIIIHRFRRVLLPQDIHPSAKDRPNGKGWRTDCCGSKF